LRVRAATGPFTADVGRVADIAPGGYALEVKIPAEGGDYGFIGVHCCHPRAWAGEEVDFVRNVANIAGGAIARRRHALEINDDILQALVVTRYALERDRLDTARETLDAALASAREMISSLLGDEQATDALPGDLRRS
jgi:GAF domain-containing protein